MLNQRVILRIFILLPIVFCVLMMAGCGKCKQLADLICACEETAQAQESCEKTADMRTSLKGFLFAFNEDICEKIINSPDCDCSAIKNHEYEKCGMTRSVNTP